MSLLHDGKTPLIDLQTIPVTRTQQATLATHVLAVSARQIPVRDHQPGESINRILVDGLGLWVKL